MGNCCPKKSDESQALNTGGNGKNPNVFHGEGHRLGTAYENTKRPLDGNTINNDDDHHHKHDVPAPIIDETLTDTDREKIRADRAAAAEARLKKQGLPVQPKKAPPMGANAPLRGPNSKPTMTWSLG